MKVKLYTSIVGVKNAIEGKQVYTSTHESQTDCIELTVDISEIEAVDGKFCVILKATKKEPAKYRRKYTCPRCPYSHYKTDIHDHEPVGCFLCGLPAEDKGIEVVE